VILRSLAAAFLVTLVATPVARAAARRFGLLDRPNERSSHRVVTPRAGGIAILLGLAAALALGSRAPFGRSAAAVAGGGLLVALVGVLDDRVRLSPWPRLACQALAAIVAVGTAGGVARLPLPPPLDVPLGPLGSAVAVVWIVAVVNFFNFMDGIDGLAGLQASITAGALALALAPSQPAPAAIAAAVAGASAAFLPFNWHPASVFLGDAGSGLIGYTLAVVPFLADDERRPELVLLAGASLFLFLADATTCLLRRARRGERWYEAHREHLYQRWARAAGSHGSVAARLGLGAIASSALALGGWRTAEAAWSWAALAVGAAALGAEWAHVRRLERRARLGG
jgi:Fuc2NAc and GlcNAc transferase